jgi:transcriptional regulator with XRE-family HTH domain
MSPTNDAGSPAAKDGTPVHPRNRGPYTNEEIAEGVNKKAGWKATSTTGIWQLRKGARAEPGFPRLVAIANFFGVKPEYFYDEDVARTTDEQLEVLAAMRDKDVRDVALRSSRLSPNSLAAVKAMIDAAYKLEGIEDAEEK